MAFGVNAEKRIVREADKIASLKQDLDALSWSRVLQIGKQLQARQDHADAALGAELISIAQSNISLFSRLGMEATPAEVHTTSSGMPVMEGGMVEASMADELVSDHKADQVVLSATEHEEAPEARESEEALTPSPAVTVPFKAVAPAPNPVTYFGALDTDPSDSEDLFDPDEPSTLVMKSTIELPLTSLGLLRQAEAAPSQSLKIESSPQEVVEQELVEKPTEEAPVQAVEAPAATAPVQATVEPVEEAPAQAGEELAVEACTQAAQEKPETTEEVPAPAVQEPAPMPVQEPTEAASALTEETPKPEPAVEPVEETPAQTEEAPAVAEHASSAAPSSRERFARFKNLYESRDGSLCVFEDEEGHLVAVDASKLA